MQGHTPWKEQNKIEWESKEGGGASTKSPRPPRPPRRPAISSPRTDKGLLTVEISPLVRYISWIYLSATDTCNRPTAAAALGPNNQIWSKILSNRWREKKKDIIIMYE